MNARLCSIFAGLLLVLPGENYAGDTSHPLLANHLQELVVLQDEHLVPLKSNPFAQAQYTVLYFGAGWCPDCRRFSPGFVRSYDHQPLSTPRFEVLLFSMDKTEADLVKFMRTEKMKWPAIAFDKLESAADLKKYAGRGIPWLSVFDQKGNLVLQSKSDADAADVLKQLEDLVKKPS